MRAWCNRIKETLLGDEHDPRHPQTYKVIQASGCPIDSPSTWLSWWDGNAVPRPSHIKAADRLSPRCSELLDLTEMRTSVSRHFLALDILTTRFRRIGRPTDHRREQAERLLRGLNDAWVSFLETSPPAKTNRFNIQNQVGQPAESLLSHCALHADQLLWAQRFGGNLARWALPPEVVLEHSWLEPLSIFRFLAMLAASDQLAHPQFVKLWAHDYASVTMIVRTLIEITELHRPRFATLRMGITGGMHMLATIAFTAPSYLLDRRSTLYTACNVYGEAAELVIANLRTAREIYFGSFAALGISEPALRALNGTHWEKPGTEHSQRREQGFDALSPRGQIGT